uniref:Uncharacterized protein n=1 Tax=viral metagenome TaxID=1070528 RepID=A0A6C0L7F0_9ZZZZ
MVNVEVMEEVNGVRIAFIGQIHEVVPKNMMDTVQHVSKGYFQMIREVK